jgi:competence protein ComEA
VRLTEGETKALLASALLVILSAIGRAVLSPQPADLRGVQLATAGIDSALAAAESTYTEAERRRQPLGVDERIDPNRASDVELDRLPGVGPSLARAIVDSRERDGPFRSRDELLRVPGLGEKKLAQLARYTTLAPAVTAHGNSVRPRESRPAAPAAARRGRIDLNRATAGELESLPGIGPAKAAALIRWRERYGRFRRLEDVLAVPGIGPATLERLRPLVALGP